MTPVSASASSVHGVHTPQDAPPAGSAEHGPRKARPRACTTARTVREQGLEPVLEALALADREHQLLVELAALNRRRRELLASAAGLLDGCASRLDEAERAGSWDYACEPSELPNGRTIAQRCKDALTILADSKRRREHDAAADDLHGLFSVFGDRLFSDSAITERLGKRALLSLHGLYGEWKAGL